MTVAAGAPLVEAQDLGVVFGGRRLFLPRPGVRAVNGVSLAIARGETLGVVGESGSGKSTLGRLLLGLLAPDSGSVRFEGRSVAALGSAERRRLRARMQIVFQDPYGSLDPRRSVGSQIADGPAIHGLVPRAALPERVAELLQTVGLDPGLAGRFPHEFSGGQRQRIGIARAIATRPDFLVADEPVSSLDVSIQAQILEVLARLKREMTLSMLFISHDLPVVRHLCDRVAVMYLGRIMEEGPAQALFARPAHPYTRALLAATPRLAARGQPRPAPLAGEPPSPADPPSGCVFRTRCAYAQPACGSTLPPLRSAPGGTLAACLRLEEIA